MRHIYQDNNRADVNDYLQSLLSEFYTVTLDLEKHPVPLANIPNGEKASWNACSSFSYKWELELNTQKLLRRNRIFAPLLFTGKQYYALNTLSYKIQTNDIIFTWNVMEEQLKHQKHIRKAKIMRKHYVTKMHYIFIPDDLLVHTELDHQGQ